MPNRAIPTLLRRYLDLLVIMKNPRRPGSPTAVSAVRPPSNIRGWEVVSAFGPHAEESLVRGVVQEADRVLYEAGPAGRHRLHIVLLHSDDVGPVALQDLLHLPDDLLALLRIHLLRLLLVEGI